MSWLYLFLNTAVYPTRPCWATLRRFTKIFQMSVASLYLSTATNSALNQLQLLNRRPCKFCTTTCVQLTLHEIACPKCELCDFLPPSELLNIAKIFPRNGKHSRKDSHSTLMQSLQFIFSLSRYPARCALTRPVLPPSQLL